MLSTLINICSFYFSHTTLCNTIILLILGTLFLLHKFGKEIFHERALNFSPSPYLHCQSVVTDERLGIHESPVENDPKYAHQLRVMADVLEVAKKEYGDDPCFFTRRDFHSPVESMSYNEVYDHVHLIGSGLMQWKSPFIQKGRFIGIYGRNSPKWICAQNACGTYGYVQVPLHDTLGQEAMRHIIEQTEIQILFCDTTERVKRLISWASEMVQYVVLMNDTDDEYSKLKEIYSGKTHLYTYDELLELGKKNKMKIPKCDPNDIFLICYTSGSTGLPKGVVHTHKSFLHGIFLGEYFVPNRKTSLGDIQTHLSFMPLAHMMEQVFTILAMLNGYRIAFLTEGISKLNADCQFYQPTLLGVVPRLLNRIYDGLMKRHVNTTLKRKLLERVVRKKLLEQKRCIFNRGGFLDFILFRSIRKELGGKIEMIVCGSAPLRKEVRQVMQVAFSCPLIEGYGMSECGFVATTTLVQDVRGDHVGSIAPTVKVKLIDVPDMGINVERDGMGEICIKSDACTPGYFKNDEATAELFDQEGFVRSGDIGQWTEHGSLKIVDRCKSIFKLAQGEYVAPERVEQAYYSIQYVSQVFVDGRSSSWFVVAIIVPSFKTLRKRLNEVYNEAAMESLTDEQLCETKTVKDLVLQDLEKVGKMKGLSGFEQAKAIYLTTEQFTVDNGLLTPTLKVARANVRKHFREVIEGLYQEKLNSET